MTTGQTIKLGDRVKDRVTGLTGIVIAQTNWLNGCIRIVVQPQETKDGRPVDPTTFDIEELRLLEADVVSPKPKARHTNGPMPSVSCDGR